MIGSARRRKRRKGSLGSYRRRRSVRKARVSGVTMLQGLGLYRGGGIFERPFSDVGFSPLVAHQSGLLRTLPATPFPYGKNPFISLNFNFMMNLHFLATQ
jgi:hypothetical protein